MDFKVCLPSHYCRWEREGWFLYFDPENFVWTRVNRDGAEIIDSFLDCNKVSEVIEKISKARNLKNEEITDSILNFVTKMLEIGFLHKDFYQKQVPEISFPSYPKSLYLNLTNRCNLKCVYCYNKRDRMSFEDDYEMSVTEDSKILKESAEIGVKRIAITGGEPLLYSDFLEVAKRAKEYGMSVQLLTNGVLINKSNAEQISKTFDAITISLDSYIKEEHEALRGKGTFEKVIKAIKILKEAGTKWLNIASVVTTKNIESMVEFHRFALENLLANQVTIQLYIPYANPLTKIERNLMPLFEKVKEMEGKINNYMRSETEKVTHPIHGRRVQCGAAIGEISVAPNGDVFPCHTLHKKEFICGNLRRQSLKEIIKSSKIINFFKDLTVDKIDKCNRCDLRYICGGGCRSMAYSISGRIDGYNNLFCEYLRYESINKLWDSSMIPLKEVVHSNSQYSKDGG